MSRIGEIKGSWEQLHKNLPDILLSYYDDLDLAEKRLSLKGKTMEQALKDQAAYPIIYSTMKAEVDTIMKYVGLQVERQRGIAFVQYTERHSRDLSDRAKDRYIDQDENYLKYQELYLEVQEIREKASAVVDAFTTRGFALRDMTQIRINQLHSVEL